MTPCCQHELNDQIQNKLLSPVLKYGLLKERMSALLTDGIRAELLESKGYTLYVDGDAVFTSDKLAHLIYDPASGTVEVA